eukprot:gene22661-19143_t
MDTAEDDSLPGLNATSSRGSAAAAGQQASFQPEAAAQQTSSMGQDAVVTTFDDTAVTFAATASASSTHTPFSIHAQPLDHDSRHVGQRRPRPFRFDFTAALQWLIETHNAEVALLHTLLADARPDDSVAWTHGEKQRLLDVLATLMLENCKLTLPILRAFRPVVLELCFRA